MRGEHSRAAAVNSLPKKRAAGSIFNLCLKLAPPKPSEREECGNIHPAEQVKQMKHPEKASGHLLVVGEGNWPFQSEMHLTSCRLNFRIT